MRVRFMGLAALLMLGVSAIAGAAPLDGRLVSGTLNPEQIVEASIDQDVAPLASIPTDGRREARLAPDHRPRRAAGSSTAAVDQDRNGRLSQDRVRLAAP